MAIRLVAILLVLLACRLLPDLVRWRDFGWWKAWIDRLSSPPNSLVVLIIGIGAPVLVCALLQWLLHGKLFGLLSVVFATLVLYYCWGPRDLERDVESIAQASDSTERALAAQGLRGEHDRAEIKPDAENLVAAAFEAGLKRWFGVLFWFALLGPVGALIYRLLQMPGVDASLAQSRAIRRTVAVFDWVPAHLVALALALASNFDAVFTTWRDYHRQHPQGYASFEPGFLDAIARASVRADVAADGEGECASSPLVALEDAMVLIRRALVVWLTLIALIVLGGWFG